MYAVGYNPVDFNDINMWAQTALNTLQQEALFLALKWKL